MMRVSYAKNPIQNDFFFRPTPSWLSPGRSTSLCLPEMNCEKHAKPSLEKAAKESECGPLRSPSNCPSAASKTQKQETKQNQKHKPQKKQQTQTKQKTTQPKTGAVGQRGALDELR